MDNRKVLMGGSGLQHGVVDIVKVRCDEDDVSGAAVDDRQCEDEELERWLDQILIDDDDSNKGELCISMDSPKDDNCVGEGRPTSGEPMATDVIMATSSTTLTSMKADEGAWVEISANLMCPCTSEILDSREGSSGRIKERR